MTVEIENKLLKDIRELEPIKTKDEEKELFKRMEQGDNTARDILILSNMKMVYQLAGQYGHPTLEFSDRVNEGVLGLITAIDKYDTESNTKFSTYAWYWVRQHITRAIYTNTRTVRLPVNVHVEMMKVYNFIEEYKETHKGEKPTVEHISKSLNIKIDKIEEHIKQLNSTIVSTEKVINEGSSEEPITISQIIEDYNAIDPNDKLIMGERKDIILRELRKVLTDRDYEILCKRYGLVGSQDGEGKVYKELSEEYGISMNWLVTIIKKAMGVLKHNPTLKSLMESE